MVLQSYHNIDNRNVKQLNFLKILNKQKILSLKNILACINIKGFQLIVLLEQQNIYKKKITKLNQFIKNMLKNFRINKIIIFSLMIALLLSKGNSNIINLQGSTTDHDGEIQVQTTSNMVDNSIYTKHFITLFGQQTFVNLIQSDHYKSGMVEQLDDIRKYNLAQLKRLSERYYPSLILIDQTTLQQLQTQQPPTLLPQYIFSTLSQMYKKQLLQLKQILQLNQHQQQQHNNQLQRQLQKLTQIKRLLQFLSRQLTAESDLRQIAYRIQQQASTKWVNQQIRQAVNKNQMVKELLGQEFVQQFNYSDQQQTNQKVRYFDAQGNQVQYNN